MIDTCSSVHVPTYIIHMIIHKSKCTIANFNKSEEEQMGCSGRGYVELLYRILCIMYIYAYELSTTGNQSIN